MDGDCIVTAFVVIDQAMAALGHRDDVRAGASDGEVLTVAVASASRRSTARVNYGLGRRG